MLFLPLKIFVKLLHFDVQFVYFGLVSTCFHVELVSPKLTGLDVEAAGMRLHTFEVGAVGFTAILEIVAATATFTGLSHSQIYKPMKNILTSHLQT